MKKRRQFIQLLLIAGLLFAVATACDKTDDPVLRSQSLGQKQQIQGEWFFCSVSKGLIYLIHLTI